MRRLTVLLLALTLALGLSGCSGGLRTEPTTSTLPAGAVASTLAGSQGEATTTTSGSGAAGSTTTTRLAGQTTTTGG